MKCWRAAVVGRYSHAALAGFLLTSAVALVVSARAATGRSVTTAVLASDTQGHPLPNLNEKDFKVTEKGDVLAITGLRRVGTSKGFITNRPPDGYVVSNGPLAAFNFPQPVTALLLDTADTDPEFQRWMQAQCLRVFTMMRPTENLAVYQLEKNGIRLLHEFSNAPSAMGDTISPGAMVRGTDHFVLNPERISPMDEGTASELETEGGDRVRRAQRYGRSCAAVTGMARYLGEFKGRKNLVWMSADFPPFGDPGTKDEDLTNGACREMLFTLAAVDVAVYPVDVRSEVAVEPFLKLLPGRVGDLSTNRRAALSPSLVPSMVTLSAVTGGKAIANRSQLAEVITDAVEASRSFYEISFEVPDTKWDGKMHVMRVSSSRDKQVTAKRLYLAGMLDGKAVANFDSPAIGISVTAAPKSDGTRMSVFIASRDLTWTQLDKGWRATIQLSLGDETTVVRSFDISNAAHEQLEQQTVSEETETTTKISVRDMASGRTGSLTIPVGGSKK